MGDDKGSKESLTDTLLLTFDVYFEETCEHYLTYELKVGTVSEKGTASSGKSTILGITFVEKSNGPRFFYSTWDADAQAFKGTTSQQTFDKLTPETGKWYGITIAVNARDDVFSFTIEDKATGASETSGDLDMTGCAGIWGFYNYGTFANNSVSTGTSAEKEAIKKSTAVKYYINDMEIYEGTYRRYPSYRESITETHLEDLNTLYNLEGTDIATKVRIADVLDYLYSTDETEFTPELRAVIPDAAKYINETYAAALCDAVGGVNKTASYYDRFAYLPNIARFDEKIDANDVLEGQPGITEQILADVVAARAAYANEIAELAVIKEQSDSFVALMAQYEAWMAEDGESTNDEYQPLNDFYTEATGAAYAKRDALYEGIAAAEESLAELSAIVTRMNDDVATFLKHANDMKAATTFGPLYAAYVGAQYSYVKYGTPALINPDMDNASHQQVVEMIAYFESEEATILAKKDECDAFNRVMAEADFASYYNSLVEKLERAKELYPLINTDYEADYPGIAEAKALYTNLNAAVEAANTASEAYINAVNAIATKTTFYEKKAAIAAALVLKETGDILGIDGVMEANIALTAAEVDINVKEGNSTTLISLVAQIKEAKTLKEQRKLIHLAKASAEKSEDTYEGVTAAKAELAAAIEAFNADVAAANGALSSATENAQAVVSTVGAKIFVKAE